jgi:hypothetical protein
MFDRYNVTSEDDLADAAKRMKDYRDARTAAQKGLHSDLNSDNNRDSGLNEEGPRIAPEPLSTS